MYLFIVLMALAIVFGLWILEVKLPVMLQKKMKKGARVSGPLFSLSASGTIGDAFTFGTWRGIPWCREWFKPANPKSVKQTNVRGAMTLVIDAWHNVLSAGQKAAYISGAAGKRLSGINLWTSRAMKAYVAQFGSTHTMASVAVAGDYPSDVITWTEVV